MDNSQGNPGSFGAILGEQGSELKEAMASRGMLAQNTMQPQQLPSQAPQGQGGQPIPQQPQPSGSFGQPLPPGSSEADTIIKALNTRLNHLSKMEEAQVIPQGGM